MTKVRTAVITHAGLVRRQNEDNFLMLPEYNLFAIADGMGGHQGGAYASSLALQVIKEEIISSKGKEKEDLREELSQAVQRANEKVFTRGHLEGDKAGMGTTLTAVLIQDWVAHLAHVGDSRAYLLRENAFCPLTKDHSLVGELLRHGSLTKREAESHPQKHLLTRALGVEEEVKVDTSSMSLCMGDLLFLCTDGLTNLVQDEEIHKAFAKEMKLEKTLEGLMDLALKRGGQDNITMIAIFLN